jgi:hypothetical protein
MQSQTGGKLGEILVELGFITRVGLAGVITEQLDAMRLTSRSRKTAAPPPPAVATATPSVVETALRERLESLTAELAAKDQRIAQQDATIGALLAQLNMTAATAA